MKRTRRRVEKEDFSRILLTETSTYDAPIIFSNLGFYWHWKKHSEGKSFFPKLMETLFSNPNLSNYTIPYTYKVRKNSDSFRLVSLIHPRSQLPFIHFYQSFDSQILLACEKSRFSIRYPEKIGSKYYVKNQDENRDKYKNRATSNVEFESRSKHLSSYFSYRTHTRLHNFFDSIDFLKLEKQFNVFWTLDVARCFDSIYTHSITWAIKNKPFSKIHRSVNNSFGSIFDRLMQSTNYNETAGIVIGSEVSRLFAEVIFQQIDKNIFDNLLELKLVNEKHYTIRRYVDDIFIFSTSEENAKIVQTVVIDCLNEYKLSINSNKTTKTTRPFITEQSKAIRLVKNSFTRFLDQILEYDSIDGKNRRVPKSIYNRKRLLVAFMQEVKLACFDSLVSYSLVSGYLVSAFSNLLIEFIEKNKDMCPIGKERSKFITFIFTIIEIIYTLYTVNPGQNGSIKIAIIIDLTSKYFDSHIPDESNAIRSLLYTLSNDFFDSAAFSETSKDDNNVATIETLNILSAVRTLGSNFLLSKEVLERIVVFSDDRKATYFEIVALLFYIRDDKEGSYFSLSKKIKCSINSMLDDLTDLKENSEKIYLLLDILACPYLDSVFRKKIARRLYKIVEAKEPTDVEAIAFAEALSRFPWFTSWDSAAMINSLEKKTLLKSY
ncbi:reverse transcriptase [compost metagenome]|uniref:antiviral reverse transcriptase Drt3b n=1 Tax=Janthinobacterium sp. KBS0711 TaxID=1649647 RepID=UPI00063A3DC5|nr:antiviral reverse transcriptase Drt3b [Janthinobacterium sp. KBS0711]KKO62444.1 Reverse transcriptase (RNA-dependent DNA polymerase) [Janthinobacterium sp. KBS0711]TSD70754.1 hypothetical protein FFI39_006885 [Janthinobacterium sp. KBS0711]